MLHAFTGGRVLTMASGPEPEVVVVDGARIAAVGERGILTQHPGVEVHDLTGRTLVPGFIDAHNHLSIAALHPQWRDVSAVVSIEELLEAVRVQAAVEPDAEWVRVCGWNEITTGVTPTRTDLDALGLDRPILVAHFSLHQGVVCSRGLAELSIGRSTPDPTGGEIARSADGEATGLLIERAWSEAHARSLAGFTDLDRWGDHVLARIPNLLRHGITAIHDAACSPEGEDLYRWLARERGLPMSVLAMPHSAAVLTNDVGKRLDGPPTGDGDEDVRVGGVKFFADGGIAIALDVSVRGQPLRMGITMDDLEERLVDAVRRGFRVGVHAMGNVGVQRAVDAFAAARRVTPDADHRFRLEHVGVASKEQCQALAALGAVAVVQPGFVDHVGDSSGGVRFDEHAWLPFATLAEAGVTLAASSDDPCAPFPPLWCSARGATRTTMTGNVFEPDQAVDFEAWLRAYTAGSAYAGGQEDERGAITPGLRADLVVLEGTLDPHDPPRVAETWVAGEAVYVADAPQ
jgi:predicted amidohydrolase YtcJ